MKKITTLLVIITCSFMYINNSLSMQNKTLLFIDNKFLVTLGDNNRLLVANNLLLNALLKQNDIIVKDKLNSRRIALQDDGNNQESELKNIIDTTEKLTELLSSTQNQLNKIYNLTLS